MCKTADHDRARTEVKVPSEGAEDLSPRVREMVEGLHELCDAMEESVTYQAILRKGRAEGRIVEARQLLLRMGQKCLGPAGPQTVAVIEAIAELERVELLVDHLLDVSSWGELLATP